MTTAAVNPVNKRRMLAAIATEIGQGEVTFPTSAQMALRIRHALYDPDCPAGTATRLIRAEPLLAARIVALANSALFRSQGRVITEVSGALARVGYSVARSLASALVIRQIAGAPANPRHRELAAALWAHTAHVAALAYVLARRFTRQDPDTAMFTGLMHEAGGFYLISRAGDYPGLLDGELPADWPGDGQDDAGEPGDRRANRRNFETRIGRAILDALAVPAPIIDAIETAWLGQLTGTLGTLGDTLLLADLLAPAASPLDRPQDGSPPHAYAIRDLAVDDATLADILKEAAADVQSLAAILRG